MRLPALLLAALALVSSSLAAPVADAPHDDFELRQLTEDNFKSSISQGTWLVEHFSPKCGHCRAFAPTWTQLAKDKQYLERLTGFHMAQVNCIAQGDLCNSNGIKFYPQLILQATFPSFPPPPQLTNPPIPSDRYIDGVQQPPFAGDRNYDELSKYIDEQSFTYAQTVLSPREDSGGGTVHGAHGEMAAGKANAEGKVQEADEMTVEALKAAGPVLVEFFAPWCGHCKHLRPTYEALAAEMKGKLNVVAVDCDANKSFCVRSDVKGYPTIRMYHHGTMTEYSGSRSLEPLKAFASKAVQVATLQPIKAADFDRIVQSDEAFFLYLQNFDTTVAELNSVKSALEPLLGSVPAYTSADPTLYSRLAIANPPPTSILLSFSSHSARPVGTLILPTSQSDISRFVNLHRFPTLVQLTAKNFQALMKSDMRAVVVLGAIHKGEEGEKEKAKLGDIARAWKRGGRRFQQPVWFVWVEGTKWAGWLKQFYGIKKKDLPGVVVIDTPMDEYYDTTIEGTQIEFDGSSIFSVLEGFHQHFLRPKRVETTLEWGSRSAARTLISLGETSVEHPFFALATLVGTVALLVFLLQSCVGRDPKDMGEKAGGPRLD